MYRPNLDSLSRFLESLTYIIDSSLYDNFIIINDFNTQPLDSATKILLKSMVL